MVEPSTGDGGHAVEVGYVIAARMSVSKLKQTRLDKGAPGREGGKGLTQRRDQSVSSPLDPQQHAPRRCRTRHPPSRRT